jgi:Icc protein
MSQRVHTVLQFTDLHLFTDPTTRLKDVCTWESFARVLGAARQRYPSPSLVVITGDIASDEAASTYQALRRLLGDWLPRCRLLPGNHDFRAGLAKRFPNCCPPRRGAAGRASPTRPLRFAATVGEWRLLGLDTHQPGQVRRPAGGWSVGVAGGPNSGLSPIAHAALRPPSTRRRSRPPWLDRIRLERPQATRRRYIDTAPQVAALFTSGHVHQELALDWRGRRLCTSPSTGRAVSAGHGRVGCRVPLARLPRDGTAAGREFTTSVPRIRTPYREAAAPFRTPHSSLPSALMLISIRSFLGLVESRQQR